MDYRPVLAVVPNLVKLTAIPFDVYVNHVPISLLICSSPTTNEFSGQLEVEDAETFTIKPN